MASLGTSVIFSVICLALLSFSVAFCTLIGVVPVVFPQHCAHSLDLVVSSKQDLMCCGEMLDMSACP